MVQELLSKILDGPTDLQFSDLGWTAAEGTLTKLHTHVWNLKLLVGRAYSTSRPVWKQCYKGK